MKCPKCEDSVAPSLLHLPFKTSLAELNCYRCNSGHLFSTAQQLNSIKLKIPEELKLKRKVSVSGNSLIIRIPSDLADSLQLTEGDDVLLSKNGKNSFLVEKT